MLRPQNSRIKSLWVLTTKSATFGTLFALTACGPSTRLGHSSEPPTQGQSAVLQERHVEERPEVAVVVRFGDPAAGLALVLSVNTTARELLALVALLEVRLERAAVKFTVQPSVNTLAIVGPIFESDNTEKLIQAIDGSVRTKVQLSEVRTPSFRERFAKRVELFRATELEVDRRGCLGDTFESPSLTLVESDESIKKLEALRRQAFSRLNARWGIVGSEAVITKAIDTIENVEKWPSLTDSVENHLDTVQVLQAKSAPGRVSLVVRTKDSNRAFALAREMSNTRGDFAERIRARFPNLHFSVFRTSALSRGACLRVDLEELGDSDSALGGDLIEATNTLVDTIRDDSPLRDISDFAKVQAVLEQPEPAIAARIAAEILLSKQDSEAKDRFYVELRTKESSPRSLEQIQSYLRGPSIQQRIETVTQIESGQGRMYALLASHCVPALEPPRLVGSAALFLSAISETFSGVDGVTLKPWVSPEGAGIVAYTGKMSPDETTFAQAERLGRALGRAVTSSLKDNDSFWRTRSVAMERMGSKPSEGLWQAITSLAPEHPGLIVPEGVYSTLAALNPTELRERHLQWQRSALKLAVLSSDTPQASERIANTVAHWRGALGTGNITCRLEAIEPPISRDIELEFDPANTENAAVTVAVPLPPGEGPEAIYAQFLRRILVQPKGVIERISIDDPTVTRPEVTLVGSTQRRGLIIAVGGPPEKGVVIVDALKRLFVDLGNGSAPSVLDYAGLDGWYRERETLRRTDPRQRLVELWKGTKSQAGTSEAGFRAYLRRTFSEGTLTFVRATPRPEKAATTPRASTKQPPLKTRSRSKTAKGP
jgi:hypothetical protein